MSLNANFLLASLFWGSIGLGYFIYGKKQQSFVPLIGGIVMMAVSYFMNPLMMSLICIGLMVLIYYLVRQGYG